MNGARSLLRHRWPAAVLIASLLLNGFLLGILTVDWLKPHRGGFSGERFARFELRRFDARLSEQAADTVAAALRPLAPEIDGRIAKLKSIRSEIMRLAAAPAPDRAAIDSQLTALRAETSAMREEVQQATYDALLALPAEERARLAETPSER